MANISPDWVTQFVSVYQRLDKDSLDLLYSIYHPEIHFIDPFHSIRGLPELHRYFENLYQNLASCHFHIHHCLWQENEVALYWDMQFQHPRLNSGKEIDVAGHSLLKAKQGLVIYHRDYLDAGAMLYEHVPLLGSAIRLLKGRMA